MENYNTKDIQINMQSFVNQSKALSKNIVFKSGSSEDDVPLSDLKVKHVVGTINYEFKDEKIVCESEEGVSTIEKKLRKEERRERRRLKRERKLKKLLKNSEFKFIDPRESKAKTKTIPFKNGKRIFSKSGSESSDFEKYLYFDESKTKRKIKLSPYLSMDDLQKQIQEIKMENICLAKEHSRINEIKLKERLKLRQEIQRLKTNIFDLQLDDESNIIPDIGSTAGILNYLIQYFKDLHSSKLSIEPTNEFQKKVLDFNFTGAAFWEDFNSIESSSPDLNPVPFWRGDLKTINPNAVTNFKPDENIFKIILEEANMIDEKLVKNGNNNSGVLEDEISADHNSPYIPTTETHVDDNSSSDGELCIEDWNPQYDDKKCDTQNEIMPSALVNQAENDTLKESKLEITHGVNAGGNGELVCDDSHCDKSRDRKADPVNNSVSDDNNQVDGDGLCSECGYDSSWPSFISRHRGAFVKGTKLTPCDNCNMRFLKSGHFDGRHRLKRPPPKKFRKGSFMCEECGMCCTSLSGLSQHRLRHLEARNSCPKCSYRCRRKSYLKKHIETHNKKSQSQHASKNPEIQDLTRNLSCELCNRVFGSAQELKKHQNAHHSKKSYPCTDCSYTTNKSNRLSQHIKTHSGEKPFHCSYCDYKSSCKSYLTSHIRYHTGEKPHKCDKCPYQCVTSTRLNVHKKIHSDERNYACSICQYRGTTSFNLKVHMRQHENKFVCNQCGVLCECVEKLSAHVKIHEAHLNND